MACGRECSEREGTLWARRKLPEDTVVRLLNCQRWGVCEAGTADSWAVDLKTVHRLPQVAAYRAEPPIAKSCVSATCPASSWMKRSPNCGHTREHGCLPPGRWGGGCGSGLRWG